MPAGPFHRLLPVRFPWRGGNRFVLLADGSQFFPRMLQAIEQARRSICIEMYLVGSGRIFTLFRDALIAAARRGVKVRLLFDDFGGLELNAEDRRLLQAPGIALLFYNRLRWRQGLRNLFRNHRKLLLVDERIAFTGGAGLTDEFSAEVHGELAWHDVMLEIHGPVVADWRVLFERTWRGLRSMLRAAEVAVPQPHGVPQIGCVVASNGPQAHHVMQSLLKRLKRARQRAWLVTPYFVPSWKLRRQLIKTAARGVDTRVLVPGKLTDHGAIRQASRRHYGQLLRHGVRIFEYQPRFMHAKIAVCDVWVSVGSTNFDRWNFYWNLDANQEVEDAAFTAQMLAMLETDFAACVELQYDLWQRRPWWWRLAERLTGRLDSWLGKLSAKLGGR